MTRKQATTADGKRSTQARASASSHQDRIKHQGRMLDEIMRWKREELPKRQAEIPLADLRALAMTVPDPLDFAAALRQPGVSLIAEVKKASPSRGLLCTDFDPARLARTYADGGAAAISVLTDSRFFQGQLEHLTTVKETLRRPSPSPTPAPGARAASRPIPVLRKDFIFDPYQVAEARVAGADALLLIVAALGDHDLRHLLRETRQHGMEALVEVHDEPEIARALAAGARVIGINNRDLRTFAVDLRTTERLRPLIPHDCIVVSESGIHTPADVRRLAALEVDAMLVGENLVIAKPEQRLGQVKKLARAGSQPEKTGKP